MSESSDSNKLVYANKISKEESNELENENDEKHFEQKSTKNKVESEELKGIFEKDEIIKELKLKIKEQQKEQKEKQQEIKEQKIKNFKMKKIIKNQNEIIEVQGEKIKEQKAKIEKDDFIINIYHNQHFLEIKNFFTKEGRQSGVNAIEQIEKYNYDHN